MNNWKLSRMAMVAAMTAVLSLGGGLSFAAGDNKTTGDKPDQKAHGPATAGGKTAPAKAASPHLGAKREMVRQQQDQRITQEQRKAGAKNLQTERLKVYNAKQTVKKSQPQTLDNK